MDVFNPKILDASIRDICTCLSNNEKAELLLYAMRNMSPEGRTRTIIENATQSCLKLSTLGEDARIKARVIRARTRISNGNLLSAQDDLQAVLMIDPDNVEANALLNSRSLSIEKLLPQSTSDPSGSPTSSSSSSNALSPSSSSPSSTSPGFTGTSGKIPRQLERISIEIWREIALFLPRRDLKTLLFVPHILSRVASQLLFRELDLHFAGGDAGLCDSDDDGAPGGAGLIAGGIIGLSSMGMGMGGAGGIVGGSGGGLGIAAASSSAGGPRYSARDRDHHHHHLHHRGGNNSLFEERDEGRHAQRTADILTRLIVDQKFANAVRMLKIYCSSRRDRDGSMSFQTGMLMNVLPKLVNLKNVYLSAPSESIVSVMRVLQVAGTRLHGLSLHSPDSPADLSFLELRSLGHFSYTTNGGTLSSLTPFFSSNRSTLSSLSLENLHPSPHWTLPATQIALRNLVSLNFTGHFGKEHGAAIMGEVLREGRQLETLSIVCCSLESGALSREFRRAITGWAPDAGGDAYGWPASAPSPTSLATNPNGTPVALPFLRNFAFTVASIGRRTADRDLFPAVGDFVRDRRELRSLRLIATCDSEYLGGGGGGGSSTGDVQTLQNAVGFDSAVWGALHSLRKLKALGITYPVDMNQGLAAQLIPRSVTALVLSVDYGSPCLRDPIGWLNALRQSVPPNLKFVGLSDLNIRHLSEVVERGFPMVRVVRVGQNYWTVHRRKYGGGTSPPLAPATPHIAAQRCSGHSHGGPGTPHAHTGAAASYHSSSSTSSSSAAAAAANAHGSPPPYSSSPRVDARRTGVGAQHSMGGGGNSGGMLARPATHTGHPHSGHTHGHPGALLPHPPQNNNNATSNNARMMHVSSSSSSSSAHGDGDRERGSELLQQQQRERGASLSGGYGGGGIMGAGILHPSSSSGGSRGDGMMMSPPLPRNSIYNATASSGSGSSSSNVHSNSPHGGSYSSHGMSAGHHPHHPHSMHVGSSSSSSSGGAGGHLANGGGPAVELEMWPRRRVVFHAAEWLEWLGCEDALVKDTSAYPAWTMCM